MTKTLPLALLLSSAALALPAHAQDVDNLPETVRDDIAEGQENTIDTDPTDPNVPDQMIIEDDDQAAMPMGTSDPMMAGTTADLATPVMTEAFAKAAGHSGHFEIESSQVALERSQDDEIRAFAQDMIAEHQAMNEQLAQVLAQELPTEPGPAQSLIVTDLKGLSGTEFDEAYLKGQVHGHAITVAFFDAIAKGGEPEAARVASEALPKLRDHLARAEELAAEMGVM